MRVIGTIAGLALAAAAPAPTPTQKQAPDAETRAWWALATDLSDDAMEGRDTGSARYDRAASLVATPFAAPG